MLEVLNVPLNNRRDVLELLERLIDSLRRHKLAIFVQSIQWLSIWIVIFLLIYGTGTLALKSITLSSTGPARSDLQADYGVWTVKLIPRIDPEIVEEIMRDRPQNPEIFMNPDAVNPDEDPFIIIQDQQGNGKPPILDTPLPTTVASEPRNTSTPEQSPTSTPIVTESPTPTPTTMPPISPTNTPEPTQAPTNTPVPQNPTSPPPPPTEQSLVTICHKPGEHNQKTMQMTEAVAQVHLAHGDYRGECTNP
jgi:cell division protein FtsN